MSEQLRFCPRCGSGLTDREDGGRTRRACADAACGYIHYDNPTPVVAGLVEHEGAVLLVRNVGWPATWYGLVSGFLERGEAPAEGLLREIDEELSLTGEVVGLIGAYPFAKMNQLILAYHVQAEGRIRLSDEIADYRHVPVERLEPWPFGTGPAVRDWLAARAPSASP